MAYKPGDRDDFDRLYRACYPRPRRTPHAITGDTAAAASLRLRAPTALSLRVNPVDWAMPDRDLREELKARLSAELSSGAPLSAPLASQARYATAAPAGVPQRHLRGRPLTLAAAALVVLLAAAFAGPPQPRAWLVRTVSNIAGNLGGQATTSSPSPGNAPPAASSPVGAPHDSRPSPEAAQTPDRD